MGRLLVVAGHGAGDSGAVGNGYTEAERVRALAARIKALGGDNVILGDTNINWYRSGTFNNVAKNFDWAAELHMDSGPETARGGHVIYNGKYAADKWDKALANFIGGFFPGRANHLVGRTDLANSNRAAARGINYRLIEFGFISNAGDVAKFNANIDKIARGVLSAFGIGTSNPIPVPVKPTPQLSQPAPAPSKPSGSNPNVKYQAFSRGKWWSDVINYNHANSNGYAGVAGSAMTGIRFNTVGSQSTAGNLQGRAHVIGRGWQAWVTDRADYIGLYGKPMDMVQFNLINLAGKQINYRVHVLGGSWLPWVRGFNNANSNGYAGIPNRQIDMIQMYVID